MLIYRTEPRPHDASALKFAGATGTCWKGTLDGLPVAVKVIPLGAVGVDEAEKVNFRTEMLFREVRLIIT